MSTWVILNNCNGQMQVGKDSLFIDLDSTGLADTIHAVHWDGTSGEVENKDPSTGEMTGNTEITSFADYAFAQTAWENAYAELLAFAKQDAYDGHYNSAIASGASEEEAVAAGNAARDALTQL